MKVPFEIKHVHRSLLVSWLETDYLDMRFGFLSDSINCLAPKQKYSKISPLDSLLYSKQAPALNNIGVIFHCARCGSTLLCQMLKQHQECLVISEPLFISQLFNEPSLSIEQKEKVLSNLLALYSAWGTSLGKCVVLKTTSWQIQHFESFYNLLEAAPKLFLFRQPEPVLKSLIHHPPSWINKNIENPESLEQRFSAAADAYRLTTSKMIDYCGFANTALLDFENLLTEIASVLEFFGLEGDDELLTFMQQQAKYNAKSRTHNRLQERYASPSENTDLCNRPDTHLLKNYSTLAHHRQNLTRLPADVAIDLS